MSAFGASGKRWIQRGVKQGDGWPLLFGDEVEVLAEYLDYETDEHRVNVRPVNRPGSAVWVDAAVTGKTLGPSPDPGDFVDLGAQEGS